MTPNFRVALLFFAVLFCCIKAFAGNALTDPGLSGPSLFFILLSVGVAFAVVLWLFFRK